MRSLWRGDYSGVEEGVKTPKGIIIGGWKPEEYPLTDGEMIQVYARSADLPPSADKGESHWIRAEDHREIMRQARQFYLDNIMIAIRNNIASALLMEQVRFGEVPDILLSTEDGACL